MENPASPPDVSRLLAHSPFAKAGEAALRNALALASVERFKLPTLLSAAGEQPQHLRLGAWAAELHRLQRVEKSPTSHPFFRR